MDGVGRKTYPPGEDPAGHRPAPPGANNAYPTTRPPYPLRAPGVRGPDALRPPPQDRLRDVSDVPRRLQAPAAVVPGMGVEGEGAEGVLPRAPDGASVRSVRPRAGCGDHSGD